MRVVYLFLHFTGLRSETLSDRYKTQKGKAEWNEGRKLSRNADWISDKVPAGRAHASGEKKEEIVKVEMEVQG